MKGNLAKFLVVVAVVALLSVPSFAKQPALVAPTDLTCTIDSGTVHCTWTAIDDATVKKYAIEVVAGYETIPDGGCDPNLWLDWNYTVPAGTTELYFNVGDLEYCPDSCFPAIVIEMVKVKGLTVPKKDGGSNAGSQNNPFAIWPAEGPGFIFCL